MAWDFEKPMNPSARRSKKTLFCWVRTVVVIALVGRVVWTVCEEYARDSAQAHWNAALFQAIRDDDAQMALLALKRGASPNATEIGRYAAWRRALDRLTGNPSPVETHKSPLLVMTEEGLYDPVIARALVAQGADINARDVLKRTVLMHAAGYVPVGEIRWLLKKGADVNAVDDSGRTALWLVGGPDRHPILRLLRTAMVKTQPR